MAIQFIGAATGTTSATIPTHQAGDLLVAFSFRNGSTSLSTQPAGWTSKNSSGASSNSLRISYRVASAPGTTSGTWTNSDALLIAVYRSTLGHTLTLENDAITNGVGTTVTYPAVTFHELTKGAWVIGVAAHRSTNTNLQNPPTGMSLRTNAVITPATDSEISLFDTADKVTEWTSTNVSVGGTSNGWHAYTVEVYEDITYDYTPGTDFLVSSDSDDGYENSSLWITSEVSMGTNSPSNYWAGIRFQNVTIPQGATITSAAFRVFSGDLTPPDGNNWGVLWGVDVDDAAPFSDTNLPSSLLGSTTSVYAEINLENYYAVDVLDIVQEIVNRPGWSSGNAMAFFGEPLETEGFVTIVTGNDYVDSTPGILTVNWEGGGEPEEIFADADIGLDDLTSSSTGTVSLSGTTSATLGSITPSATATVSITGSTITPLEGLTGSSTATVEVAGTVSATLDDVQLSSTLTLEDAITASVDLTLDELTGSSTGTVLVSAVETTTLDDISVSIAGVVPIVVDSNATLDALSSSSTIDLPAIATVTSTLDDITLSSAATNLISGSATPTLDVITSSSAGTVSVTGSVSVTLDSISLAAPVTVLLSAALSKTLDDLTSSATSTVDISAALTQTLDNITFVSDTDPITTASASNTLDALAISSTTNAIATGISDVTLDDLTGQSDGTVSVTADANITLSDTLLSAGNTTENIARVDITLDNLITEIDGTVSLTGDVTPTLDIIALSSETAVSNSASADITLSSLVSNATLDIPVVANTTSTLDGLTSSSEIEIGDITFIDSSITLGDTTLSSSGTVSNTGSVAGSLDDVDLTSITDVILTGQAAITLDGVSISSQSTSTVIAAVSNTLDGISVSSGVEIPIEAELALSFSDMTASGTLILTDADVSANVNKTLDGIILSTTGTILVAANANMTLGDMTGNIKLTGPGQSSGVIKQAFALLIGF